MAVTLPATPLAAQSDLDALAARVTALEQAHPIPPTPTAPSKTGTYITKVTDPAVIDDAMNQWTLVAASDPTKGLQVACEAALAAPPPVVDPLTYNVAKLGIDLVGGKRQVLQQNSAGSWYTKPTASAAWAQVAGPDVPVTPGANYRVVNGQIVDPTGAPFRGRGVNVNYLQVWGNGQVDLGRVNRACLQKAFPGINFVRFACWGGGLPPVGDATTAAWVDDLTANGIIVMFDLHYTGDAISPADGTASAWFAGWSKHYAGNPRVWWDTQNEPHGAGISAMMLGQYNAIRSGGSQSPILLCTGNPGGEITGMNPADIAQMSNVGFDSHYYGWMPSNGIPWSTVLQQLSGFHSKDGAIPVLCCETGDSTDGNTRDANWMDVLNASLANPAGFACWYMNWNATGGDLLLAAPFDGSQLTDYGQVVANAIKSG